MKAGQMQMDLGELEQNQSGKGHHAFIAKRLAESPAGEIRLMESVCERGNMEKALQRVEQNAGAPGMDGMKTTQLRGYLRRHWERIKASLLEGNYKPMPVLRKEIEKPDGGVRQLGIPTVLDRLVQQAMAQVLQELWDHTFSEYSYGFRPNRSQQMAIQQARCYVEGGYTHVVDIDLAKFFDRVNWDRLMNRLAQRITDKRMLRLAPLVDAAEAPATHIVLMPVPASTGTIDANRTMAKAIADQLRLRYCRSAAVKVTVGRQHPVESSCARRRRSVAAAGLPLEEHAMIRVAGPLTATNTAYYFVDNMATTGTTLAACRVALGFGEGIVWADAGKLPEQHNRRN